MLSEIAKKTLLSTEIGGPCNVFTSKPKNFFLNFNNKSVKSTIISLIYWYTTKPIHEDASSNKISLFMIAALSSATFPLSILSQGREFWAQLVHTSDALPPNCHWVLQSARAARSQCQTSSSCEIRYRIKTQKLETLQKWKNKIILTFFSSADFPSLLALSMAQLRRVRLVVVIYKFMARRCGVDVNFFPLACHLISWDATRVRSQKSCNVQCRGRREEMKLLKLMMHVSNVEKLWYFMWNLKVIIRPPALTCCYALLLTSS